MRPNHLKRPGGMHYAVLHKGLTIASLACTLLLVSPFYYVADKYQSPLCAVIGGILFLSGLFISIFFVREVVNHMEAQGTLLFRNAVLDTVNGYVLKLCFIPVLGPLVERWAVRGREKNPFVVRDEEAE